VSTTEQCLINWDSPPNGETRMPSKQPKSTSLDVAASICQAVAELASLPTDERIHAINTIKQALHDVSPFREEPVDCVLWVKNEQVTANDYNPNSVAPPEMKLLEISITADGYTQPIVADADEESGQFVVVDGFHRNRVGRESEAVRERVHGYLPLVQIRSTQAGRGERIASTIRHNRARGKHQVERMSEIVLELKRRNWSDEKVGRELGMDPDEVLRLAQISGLAEAFRDREFSMAWEADLTAEDEEVLAAAAKEEFITEGEDE
jgi:ParB-like chromosome segregation protein Spo0J